MRILGAFLVFAGCSGFGFSMAAAVRTEEAALRQLLRALEFMYAELSYRMPPLGALCRSTGAIVKGPVQKVFLALAEEVERREAPDGKACMEAVLEKRRVSPGVREQLLLLGETLGRFDLPGQLRGLDQVRGEVQRLLTQMEQGRENRLRSYQTLGLCAGAAIAILLL